MAFGLCFTEVGGGYRFDRLSIAIAVLTIITLSKQSYDSSVIENIMI